ncbi:HB2J protein, partial [Ploceus nigricollis]|nr:HB2J protein [Ploceus nigricollis]
ECQFINGTEKARFVTRRIYNRLQYMMFDSDVGHFVGFTPYGEKQARYRNSNPEILEYNRAVVDTYCRHNYPIFAPFSAERRALLVPIPGPPVPPSPSQSLPAHSQ